MKILFTFENNLPSAEADAEVFLTTAKYLAPLVEQAWLHVPLANPAGAYAIGRDLGMAAVCAIAPLRLAALRHFCCGLTLVLRREFRQADLVYTRNLWIAGMAVLFAKRVAFDHYRPWPDQIPPLQPWLHRLMSSRRFLINICHSNYTLLKYRAIGVPAEKLCCIHNGYEPQRLLPVLSKYAARQAIGIDADRTTIVYTGRLNHKKGLELVLQAAVQLPDILFMLVGSYGEGPIEAAARPIANIRIVPWQAPASLQSYIYAADILLIPPSWKPLAEFGSTVLPLKLFLYMASARPILAGATPDVMEVLRHRHNAVLCEPDSLPALIEGIASLTGDAPFAASLAAAAATDSADLTWHARAASIAAILALRLRAEPARARHWRGRNYRAWGRHSAQWLRHVIRKRSWILPPRFPADALHAAAPD